MSLILTRRWQGLKLLVIGLSFIDITDAFRAFTKTSFASTNLTVQCVGALSYDIACSPAVAGLRLGEYYSEDTLTRTCTSDCGEALEEYAKKVASACEKQTWNGYEDTVMPLAIIPDMLRYHYNLTCLMDSGRYCNTVAGESAARLESEENQSFIGRSLGFDDSTGSKNAVDACDLCSIKNLHFQASSPYFNGPELQERSIYQSKTSSCGVTGYPLATSTLPFYYPQASAAPSLSAISTQWNLNTCAGKIYNIKPTDDCHSISTNQKIGTGWLLTDNQLQAYCADFPKAGSLCLVNRCDVYTLNENDTCSTTAKANGITETQLKAWNPIIDGGCYNLKRMNGTQVCISPPGKPQSAEKPTGTQSTTAASIITSAPVAAIPSNVAKQVNMQCSQYYTALEGDYCNLLIMKYSISLADFLFLNKDVNANCTNLLAQYSYCVKPVGDINTYSGRPGYSNPSATADNPTLKYTDLPQATYVMKTSTTTILPLASGTREGCGSYFNGDRFQEISQPEDWYPSQCAFAADIYGVDLNDFADWNSGLGDVRAQSCSFQKGFQYCGKYYWGEDVAPTTDAPPSTTAASPTTLSSPEASGNSAASSSSPSTNIPSKGDPNSKLPVRDNASKSCTTYVDVLEGDKCEDVLKKTGLGIEEFYKLNPDVKNDCSNLWPKYQYCVQASG